MGPRLPLELIARSLSSYLLEDQAIRIKAAAPTSLHCVWLTAAPFAATSLKHSTSQSVTLECRGCEQEGQGLSEAEAQCVLQDWVHTHTHTHTHTNTHTHTHTHAARLHAHTLSVCAF